MKKRTLLIALALMLMLSTVSAAVYVPCSDGQESHAYGEWTEVEKIGDTAVLNRTCQKCGYVQVGNSTDPMQREEYIAVTLSLTPNSQAAYNPSTGAAV